MSKFAEPQLRLPAQATSAGHQRRPPAQATSAGQLYERFPPSAAVPSGRLAMPALGHLGGWRGDAIPVGTYHEHPFPPDRTRAAGAAVFIAKDPIHRDRPGPSPRRSDGFPTEPRAADRFARLRGGAGEKTRRATTLPRPRGPAVPAVPWFVFPPAPRPRGRAHSRRLLARKTPYTVSRCRHGRSGGVRPAVSADRMCSKNPMHREDGRCGIPPVRANGGSPVRPAHDARGMVGVASVRTPLAP